MADTPQYLLVVRAEIEPAVEDAWNKWYDEEHFPDVLASPGVLGGGRYLSVRDARMIEAGKKSSSSAKTYLAVYELTGPEVLETPEFIDMRGWHQFSNNITARTEVFEKI